MKRSVLSTFATVVTTLLAAATVVLVATGPANASGVPYAGNAHRVSQRLHFAIKHLPVRHQTPAGYLRSKFTLWADANHNCRDTRAEVLASESQRHTRGRCTISTGRWTSYYDHRTFTSAHSLDIDHLVPLAEAWRSGARGWGHARREAYANDLGDWRTLVAVSAHANRSKGDRDPSTWMPAYGKCTYVRQWVAVKMRWGLSVDRHERHALLRRSRHCGNARITTHRAVVRYSRSGGGGGTTGGGSGGKDPRYDTCTDAIAHGYGPYVRNQDPEYYWYEDRDNDGIVCE